MDTLSELLEDELKDIYSAENQLSKSLPKLAKKATTASLKEAFLTHLEETKGHIERLKTIGEKLEIKLTGKKCHAMEGLVAEGQELIEEEESSVVLDAGLIGAAQRVEHYEMAAYGTVKALATALGHKEVVVLLQTTLNEESATDAKLTKIALKDVVPAAMEHEEEEDEEEGE